jgi:hypothetical protein
MYNQRRTFLFDEQSQTGEKSSPFWPQHVWRVLHKSSRMQGMAKRLNAHLNKRLVSSLAKIPLSHEHE